MKYIFKKYIYLYLVCFITNLRYCSNNYTIFNMTMNINSELEIMHLKSENDICQDWIPSLFSSILLIPYGIDIDHKFPIEERIIKDIPSLSLDEELNVILYNYKFLNKYNAILGQVIFSRFFTNCYLGLSYKDSNELNESYIFLNKLKEDSHIDKKIFSFDKWTLMRNSIKSNLYLGDFHKNFIKPDKKGIIASCEVYGDYPFWGCSFDSLGFKNNFISLKNVDNELYKIFFSTENYNIIFPKSFKGKFYELINNSCIEEYDEEHERFLTCANNIFNDNGYFNMKLITLYFNITVEIDSKARFSLSENQSKNKTRIKFSNIDYFIFPLIMFKNFDVQFDAEKNIISFFTTDNSILSVVRVKDEKSDKGLSKGLIALIVILSILVALIIGFIIYRFMRIKKESDIQKDAKKIEEIEEFHSMN